MLVNTISPHQMPFATEVARRLGPENFRYVAIGEEHPERAALGWGVASLPDWVHGGTGAADACAANADWLEHADILLTGDRRFDLFGRRSSRSLATFYMSERWLKPPVGIMRRLSPSYRRMCGRFRVAMASPFVRYLAIGGWAANDIRRATGVVDGIHAWAFFVEQSPEPAPLRQRQGRPLEVLWVGRMLRLKRVDTLIRAVTRLAADGRDLRLMLAGRGPDEPRLRRLAASLQGSAERGPVTFRGPVPIAEVRGLMRAADVYVLPSNGCEGWGAVVNEAMIEGCAVVASRQAGAGMTLVEDGLNGLVFDSGSVAQLEAALAKVVADEPLRQRLAAAGQRTVRECWSPAVAAERFVEAAGCVRRGRPVPDYPSGPLRRLG
jgi:glycosyltransferase involved in cell wall biosynthesis